MKLKTPPWYDLSTWQKREREREIERKKDEIWCMMREQWEWVKGNKKGWEWRKYEEMWDMGVTWEIGDHWFIWDEADLTSPHAVSCVPTLPFTWLLAYFLSLLSIFTLHLPRDYQILVLQISKISPSFEYIISLSNQMS